MDIPVGYQLHINSWENDADAYQTEILSGLTKEDVNFYLSIVSQFRSRNQHQGCYGNGEVTSSQLSAIFKKALKDHPSISEKVKQDFALVSKEEDEEDFDEDHPYQLVQQLLGYPVNDAYDATFCRVFASHQVFLIEKPIVDVTSEFKIAKK